MNVSVAILEALKNKYSYSPIKFVPCLEATGKTFNIMGFNVEEFQPTVKAISTHDFKYT